MSKNNEIVGNLQSMDSAQQHQQQLKDQNHSPLKPKMQSPRVQSRIASRHMGRSPDRLTSSYHSALSKTNSPSHQMSMSCSGDIASVPQVMSQSFDSPGLMYATEKKDKEKEKTTESPPKPVNHSLEAASKMVPVPESLMSPDYQDPIYDIQRTIPKPTNNSVNSISNTSSQSSNSSLHEEKPHRQIVQPNKNIRGSPKLTKSATSSPKLKSKIERKCSLPKSEVKEEKKMNGITKEQSTDQIDQDKLEIIKLASNQRRQKKMSEESMAAVTIQKMWRGYKSRNLNKDTMRILHAIQAARARQHIQRLTCDMEATKAALESERKIQQLQMQAINALWKKVSTLQSSDSQKQKVCDLEDSTEAVRQLTETCARLQQQVAELQGYNSEFVDLGDQYPQNILNSVEVTEQQVYNVLKSIDASKGAGPDGIPPLFIKRTSKFLALPLKLIFEKSVTSGIFPSEWKRSHVIPIFKKGNKEDVTNYRPVSIISQFAKVFERIIYPTLTNYFKNFITDSQHGFCSGKSTVSNLMDYTTELIKSVDGRLQVDSVYTDLSSAFDKVDHGILLSKLKAYGIHGDLLRWISSYLKDRIQSVTVHGYKSDDYVSISGVPQGSHLGPILFLAFINDISVSIKYSKFSIFADDLKLYRVVNNQEDSSLLQRDIDAVVGWCNANKMKLNPQKCTHIKFTRKETPFASYYSVSDHRLKESSNIRDLGVLLDSKLNFVDHIDSIVTQSWKMLGLVKRVSKDFKNIDTLKTIFNALVR
ncbi:hypothetical protein evm_015082, partial [Chilo suppressalis]